MKTPREILLERHRKADARLDAIREEVLSDNARSSAKSERIELGAIPALIVKKLWLELVWPCRRIWAGLAAVWLVIGTVYVFSGGSSGGSATLAQVPPPQTQAISALRERNEMLAQYLDGAQAPAAPEPSRPGPRSSARAARICV
jgi:hypothetical protein